MKFYKLTATGNDFILFDNRDGSIQGDDGEFFRLICRRRLSVGADGILLVEKSDAHDFSLRYFNSDGSLGEMCGNGARAASHFAHVAQIAGAKMSFDVVGIEYTAEIRDAGVTLTMPAPVEIREFPEAVEEPFLSEGAWLNVGVPHYVLFAEDVDGLDVIPLGRKYRHHANFQPWGTNVNFVQIVDAHRMKIRTYERGVEDETFACGTGTISSVITAVKQKNMKQPVEAELLGGILRVELENDLSRIYLTGEARIVFEGALRDYE
ncbi:MAG: diaminopimelate epimerase [candidate division KSB1 bacterium]|jgi:diaminopimelate epimerase|nr:diaminopimelate epimerase [candidate division KSB1 bacterium]